MWPASRSICVCLYLCLSVCLYVCVWVPQNILPLDYALKLLFMFMEIVFRAAIHAHLPTTPSAAATLSCAPSDRIILILCA